MSLQSRVEKLEQWAGLSETEVDCRNCTDLMVAVAEAYGEPVPRELVRHAPHACETAFTNLRKVYGSGGGDGDGVRLAA
jgi:hypothetical protein